eukprot:6172428-Pleurochrysis_carterae.AAC.11
MGHIASRIPVRNTSSSKWLFEAGCSLLSSRTSHGPLPVGLRVFRVFTGKPNKSFNTGIRGNGKSMVADYVTQTDCDKLRCAGAKPHLAWPVELTSREHSFRTPFVKATQGPDLQSNFQEALF